ncbi:MAG: sugar kinase [Novosphingobium sp.]
MARIVCCGEGMLELSHEGEWKLGYGGDTLNTAIHLARLGHDVAYLTALGEDPFSADLRKRWAGDEGLDTSLIQTHPSRNVGLYAITTDDAGERSFTYWRETSAARELFDLADNGLRQRAIAGCDLFYYSLISAAVLPRNGQIGLVMLANMVREAGGRVAFDGNYRPRLWDSTATAVAMHDAAIRGADIGLPTLDDECALAGECDAEAVAAHWESLGCAETVVKLGADGCRLPGGAVVAPLQTLVPVDTSGAGDAFNAGYLDARLRGIAPAKAAAAGHELAGWTIMRPGAIPPREG